MVEIDYQAYQKLVNEAENGKFLENLLAYSLYKEMLARIHARHIKENKSEPTDEYLEELFFHYGGIKLLRSAAKAQIDDKILQEHKADQNKASWWKRFSESLMIVLAAKVTIGLLLLLITIILTTLGLYDKLPFLK